MTVYRNETMGRIVARVWSDTDFKCRLLADTRAALAELGLAIPKGKTVVAVENTATLTYIVLTAPRFTETKSSLLEDQGVWRILPGCKIVSAELGQPRSRIHGEVQIRSESRAASHRG